VHPTDMKGSYPLHPIPCNLHVMGHGQLPFMKKTRQTPDHMEIPTMS
jgi:hypothetical protein